MENVALARGTQAPGMNSFSPDQMSNDLDFWRVSVFAGPKQLHT
jgi:hypothetical protein